MEKQKLAVCLLLLGLITFSIFAYVSASGSFGFEVYETHTHAWDIDLDTVYVGISARYTQRHTSFSDSFFYRISASMKNDGSLSI